MYYVFDQRRRHGFLSGGSNRQQDGQPTPKYHKNRKKTPDFGHFILESGGVDHPGFQKCVGLDPPPPPTPPPVGDAPVFDTLVCGIIIFEFERNLNVI